jgi:hypothetical protein
MAVAITPKSAGAKSLARMTNTMGEAVRETISVKAAHLTDRVALAVIDSAFIW